MPVTPAKLDAAVAYESPARWRYHPHVVAAMRARAELVPGRVLFAGARGERWLLDVGAGRLESAVPAPEDLVAILSGPSSGYSFVGKSGATYRADEPLGRFVASTVPFEPLAEVAGSNRVLFAVRRDRRLVRSVDAGASFTPVGPSNVAFVDVETDASGNALALGFPEALFKSGDGGASWQPPRRADARRHRTRARSLERSHSRRHGARSARVSCGRLARRGSLDVGGCSAQGNSAARWPERGRVCGGARRVGRRRVRRSETRRQPQLVLGVSERTPEGPAAHATARRGQGLPRAPPRGIRKIPAACLLSRRARAHAGGRALREQRRRARRSFARNPTFTQDSATFAWPSAPAARGS